MAGMRKTGKSKSGASRRPAAAKKASPAAATAAANRERKKDDPHPIEWVAGAISAVLVLAVLGYLCFRSLSGDGQPPDFVVRVVSVEPAGELFHVTVSVANTGDERGKGADNRDEACQDDCFAAMPFIKTLGLLNVLVLE